MPRSKTKARHPARLGALARGYAILGSLTSFHWNSGSKALRARALLASQRLVALDPRSPGALWHRAFVCALIGLHKHALDDLAAAEKLAKAQSPAEARPSWVPLIDAFCRFQTNKLLDAKSGPDGQFAMYLAFLTCEEAELCLTRPIAIGEDLLRENPECYRVHDRLSGYPGVNLGHRASLAGMQAYTQAMPGRPQGSARLAKQVVEKLNAEAEEPEIARAFVAAGKSEDDQGEPSWSSLGRMLVDVRFAQVIRRAYFMQWTWNVPVAEFVAEARPLVIDHPYLPLFDSYAA